jgi:carbonic anhydrase/acetyltransferase-like protein (isoleucine patch superfamily)
VTEGKIFPPASLIIGSPARAVRTLEPGEVEKLRASAAGYVRRAADYAGTLQRVDEERRRGRGGR